MGTLKQSRLYWAGVALCGVGLMASLAFSFIYWRLLPGGDEFREINGALQTPPQVRRYVKGFPWIEFSVASDSGSFVLRVPNIPFLNESALERTKNLKVGDRITAKTIDYSSAQDDKNIIWELKAESNSVFSIGDRITAEKNIYMRNIWGSFAFVGLGFVLVLGGWLTQKQNQRKKMSNPPV